MLDFNYIKENYNKISRNIQGVNAIICGLLIIFLLSSPNIKLFIFNKDIKGGIMFVLLFCLIFFIILILPLLRVVSNNIYSVIFSLISLIITCYFVYNIFDWCTTQSEGILSYKGVKIIMTASYETKLQEFLQAIEINIPIIAGNDLQLKQFLNNHPIITKISPMELNKCNLVDISILAKEKLHLILNEYNSMMELAARNRMLHNPSNDNLKKNILIGTGVILGIIVIYYCVSTFSLSGLSWINKKSQDITTKGLELSHDMNNYNISNQNLTIAVEEATAQMSKQVANMMKLTGDLCSQVNNIEDRIPNMEHSLNMLTDNTEVLQKELIKLSNISKILFKFIINVYVPKLTSTLGTLDGSLIQKLPPNVKEFIQ